MTPLDYSDGLPLLVSKMQLQLLRDRLSEF